MGVFYPDALMLSRVALKSYIIYPIRMIWYNLRSGGTISINSGEETLKVLKTFRV
jgi:hypothetical protein